MEVITNKYISLGVGSKDNKKNFNLASTVDTTDFIGGGTFNETNVSATGLSINDCKALHLTMTATQTTNNRTILESIGLLHSIKENYAAIPFVPEYRALSNDQTFNGATNTEFQRVPVGIKPDNWDAEYDQHYYTKTDSDPTNDNGAWRNLRTNATWDENTQYYYNAEVGNYYWINDGEKRLKFFLGKGPLSYDSNRMNLCILRSQVGSTNTGYWDGWFTLEWDESGETQQKLLSPSSHYTINSQTDPTGISNMFAGNDYGNRNINSSTYNSGWKSGTSDEAKAAWRSAMVNGLTIKNATITQFGQVKKGDRTYFGIWIIYPQPKYYMGHNGNNDIRLSSGSTAQWGDLRYYGFLEEPVSMENMDWNSVEFIGIELSKIDVDIEVKEGKVPPDVNPNPTPSANWPKLDPVKLHGRTMGTLAGINESGFHIYDMDAGDFNTLQGDIWNWGDYTQRWAQSVQEQMNVDPLNWPQESFVSAFRAAFSELRESRIDPLSAIVFARLLPGFIDTSVRVIGDYGHVKIAGLEREQMAYAVHQEVYSASMDIDCSELLTTESYLDLAPFSTAEIYLPYIGLVNLDPQDIVGGRIEVLYNVCVLDGTCSAVVYCYSAFAPTYPTQYGPYEGAADFTIPLAQKDANAFQRQLGYMKAIGAGVSGVVGATLNSFNGLSRGAAHNPGLLANTALQNGGMMLEGSANMATGLVDAYMMKQAFHGTQLGSGAAIVTPTDSIYLIVTTPFPKYLDFDEVKKFGNTSGKITTVNGAKSADGPVFCKWKYIDTSGITATAAEIEAIKAIMLGGVYL